MEAVRTSETKVYSKTTRRYIWEGCHLARSRENLKSHILLLICILFDEVVSEIMYCQMRLMNNELETKLY
jgi:hypothetical protein